SHCDCLRRLLETLDMPMIERLLAFIASRLAKHGPRAGRLGDPHDWLMRVLAETRDGLHPCHHIDRYGAFAHLCRVIDGLIDEAEMNEESRKLRVI
ncbi:MAG TPA: hypothetical protein VFO89_06380, partial [Thermoanaerobaculia bacterium]|nr:hypothetical protein [Thermoanaerobaculia bacterium]